MNEIIQNTLQTADTSTHVTKTPTQLSKHPHIKKPTHTKTYTLQNPHIHTPTHYKTHTYTHPHITKPTHTHTRTLEKKLKQPQYKIHTK
jgi:hypothetical protein